MARQPPAGRTRDLAVVLHDIAWLLPRKIEPWAEAGLDELPSSELEVMRLLVRAPGLSVGEVARELGLQPSNASAAIRALLARGLLARKPDGRDGRITRLSPTAKAQAIRRQREGAWGELLRARLAHLQPEDVNQLLGSVDALVALAANLSAATD
jgi:DNA-binding MarR family transcriptional regulator